jgi:hypothetical protein
VARRRRNNRQPPNDPRPVANSWNRYTVSSVHNIPHGTTQSWQPLDVAAFINQEHLGSQIPQNSFIEFRIFQIDVYEQKLGQLRSVALTVYDWSPPFDASAPSPTNWIRPIFNKIDHGALNSFAKLRYTARGPNKFKTFFGDGNQNKLFEIHSPVNYDMLTTCIVRGVWRIDLTFLENKSYVSPLATHVTFRDETPRPLGPCVNPLGDEDVDDYDDETNEIDEYDGNPDLDLLGHDYSQMSLN